RPRYPATVSAWLRRPSKMVSLREILFHCVRLAAGTGSRVRLRGVAVAVRHLAIRAFWTRQCIERRAVFAQNTIKACCRGALPNGCGHDDFHAARICCLERTAVIVRIATLRLD